VRDGTRGQIHRRAPPPKIFNMEHFNQLTPAEAERLAILAEECGEVIQVVGKILRHGYYSRHPDGGPTNREMLEIELGDIDCAKALLIQRGDIGTAAIISASYKKIKKMGKYLHHNTVVDL